MPRYLCTQNTTLPNGCIAFSGESYEIPDSFALKGSWKSPEEKQDVPTEQDEEYVEAVDPTQDEPSGDSGMHEEVANIVFQ